MVIFPARLSTVHTVAQSISEVNNYVIRTELVTVIKVVASIQKRDFNLFLQVTLICPRGESQQKKLPNVKKNLQRLKL